MCPSEPYLRSEQLVATLWRLLRIAYTALASDNQVMRLWVHEEIGEFLRENDKL